MLSSQPSSLLLIFPGFLIAAEAPQGCSGMPQDAHSRRKVPISTAWCIPPQGGIRCCAGIGAFPSADSKEDGEAKSWSSCFSRGGDDHGFSDTLLPWHVLVGSSAGQCSGQDTVGMGSAPCFHLARIDLCWQWQKNLPGIQEGRRGQAWRWHHCKAVIPVFCSSL